MNASAIVVVLDNHRDGHRCVDVLDASFLDARCHQLGPTGTLAWRRIVDRALMTNPTGPTTILVDDLALWLGVLPSMLWRLLAPAGRLERFGALQWSGVETDRPLVTVRRFTVRAAVRAR